MTVAEAVILVDQPAPFVVRILINRPKARNAIDAAVRDQIGAALAAALLRPGTRAMVFGGAGGMFSAGGDLPSMANLSPDAARTRLRQVHALCRAVATAHVPVVSAVEGVAAGGAVGLALLGDHIVSGEGSRLLFPFLSLGLVPDWGQLLTLPRRVGLPAARRFLTEGGAVRADEALRSGLVDVVVPDDQVMARAVIAASALARLPREAWARTKRRLAGALEDDLRQEEDDQVACLTGPEFAEGYAAFFAKRAADFTALGGAS